MRWRGEQAREALPAGLKDALSDAGRTSSPPRGRAEDEAKRFAHTRVADALVGPTAWTRQGAAGATCTTGTRLADDEGREHARDVGALGVAVGHMPWLLHGPTAPVRLGRGIPECLPRLAGLLRAYGVDNRSRGFARLGPGYRVDAVGMTWAWRSTVRS